MPNTPPGRPADILADLAIHIGILDSGNPRRAPIGEYQYRKLRPEFVERLHEIKSDDIANIRRDLVYISGYAGIAPCTTKVFRLK